MNLTLSLILYPHFLAPRQQFLLNQAIALGLFDFLGLFLPKGLKIKWSNDLYVEKRKISGMLLQNSLSSHKILSSVVGLGININQKAFGASLPNPTSLALETGQHYPDLHPLLSQLCQCLEKRYLQLKSGDLASIHQDYLQNLYQFQQKAQYQRPDGSIFSGTITGLDPSGKLIVAHDGASEAFALKEIIFLH